MRDTSTRRGRGSESELDQLFFCFRSQALYLYYHDVSLSSFPIGESRSEIKIQRVEKENNQEP